MSLPWLEKASRVVGDVGVLEETGKNGIPIL
jgi:hypothetical protein